MADKLLCAESLTDDRPGAGFGTLDAPGRPAALRPRDARRRTRSGFPKLSELADERKRGEVLHFFANHELLALELMALMLLRFPAAPKAFRRGLVATMADEQRHLMLYLRRMEDAGVALGTIPVNDFFWRCLRDVDSPADFAARMSLTFEQANLDYAGFYAKAFAEVGDAETADALNIVLRDEIRHVRHGLVWFQRWRQQDQSLWDSYVRAVVSFGSPLTPARAKGLGFDVAARQQAGLPDDYIESLRLYSSSKGRPPDVFWFDPMCEIELAAGRVQTPNRQIEDLRTDLATLPMFLAAPDDVVLVDRRPSLEFCRQCDDAGFTIPEWVERDPKGSELAHRLVGQWCPWGWGPGAYAQRIRSAGERPSESVSPPELDLNEWRRLYSKAFWIEEFWTKEWADIRREFDAADSADSGWLCAADDAGRVARDRHEAQEMWGEIRGRIGPQVLLKAPLAASGRGNRVCRDGDSWSDHAAWAERVLREQGAVVIEPFRDRVLDLSAHARLEPDGTVQWLGWTRFHTDATGRYLGSHVGRVESGLSSELLRFLHGHGVAPRRVEKMLESVLRRVARRLHQSGYAGRASVDAMLFRDGDTLRLKPLVEVNPRTTMGHITLALASHVSPGSAGRWGIAHAAELRREGSTDFEGWARQRQVAAPILRDSHGRIVSGFLALAESSRARSFLPWMQIGRAAESA